MGVPPSVMSTTQTATAPVASASPLPLRQVVLFSSGVAYLVRSAEITGELHFELTVRREQASDVLKSLVLLDPSGKVGAVRYSGAEPLERRLPIAALADSASTTLLSLLRRFQGARVEVDSAIGRALQGRILSVSREVFHREGSRQEPEVRETLNLLTTDGLLSIPAASIERVRLLDERLDADLRATVELLAGARDETERVMQISFGDGGARSVSAGYLLPAPVWKSSYRLALTEGEDPYLQGWSIVENTTGEDWNEIGLQLIAGRPISFAYDLFEPRYVTRPVLRPGRDHGLDELLEPEDDEEVGVLYSRGAPDAMRIAAMEALAPEQASMRASVKVEVDAEAKGELFAYSIEEPISVPRGSSAMAPLLSTSVECEPIALYSPAEHPTRVMTAVLLTNSTGLHLAPGPVTLYSEGIYAGDAMLPQMGPGHTEILSHGLQWDLEALEEPEKRTRQRASMRIEAGVLRIKYLTRRTVTYRLTSKGEQRRTVIVRHPVQHGFKLIEPAEKPPERDGCLELRTVLQPRAEAKVRVVYERVDGEAVVLLEAPIQAIAAWYEGGPATGELAAALKTVVAARSELREVEARAKRLEKEIEAIDRDQTRIRKNMQQLEAESPLRRRYVEQLEAGEDRLVEIRSQLAAIPAEIDARTHEIELRVRQLDIEAA